MQDKIDYRKFSYEEETGFDVEKKGFSLSNFDKKTKIEVGIFIAVVLIIVSLFLFRFIGKMSFSKEVQDIREDPSDPASQIHE